MHAMLWLIKPVRCSVLACALVLSGPAAFASEHAAGGLVAYEPLDISLVRQDLHISPELIRVTYVLKADTAQEATMAFPMPPVPVQGGPDFLGGAEINESDPRNYMHFSALVGGQPVQPRIVESAYVGDADVGEALGAAGLPLLISPDTASDLIASLPAEQFYSLEEKRIVSRGGDDPPHFSPLWSYQASLEWKQAFPAGTTTIDISYRPLIGIVEDPIEFLQSSEMAMKYCLGQGTIQVGAGEIATLGYLIDLMPFWKGPVVEFNLAVDSAGDESPGGGRVTTAYCAKTTGALEIAFIRTSGAP